MRLPPQPLLNTAWPEATALAWQDAYLHADKLAKGGPGGDAFNEECQRLSSLLRKPSIRFAEFTLQRRISARACSWLWLNDADFSACTLTLSNIEGLLHAQQPRLTRITLEQIGKLFFQSFDQLDDDILSELRRAIPAQCHRLPARREAESPSDVLSGFAANSWLFDEDGPTQLVEQAMAQGYDLDVYFERLCLGGLEDGRYGDVCRAQYYLVKLLNIELGEWDPILDELLKPNVCRAPYRNDRRIGHAALKIIIDRSGDTAFEPWQKFVLSLAGDPRMGKLSPSYIEWWQVLGAERIEKVQGWLAREDLKLFLNAVEQYGIEKNKLDLQRMFPARKRFLEGLYELKLVRNTRLMLGRNAERSVKNILGDDIKVTYAELIGSMADKAVICVDCGDFYLVEGSHSFMLWIYLAKPGYLDVENSGNLIDHSDLTKRTPRFYQTEYPKLPLTQITHNGSWQKKAFDFLAKNGIELDFEALLNANEYRSYLSRFGVPYVNPIKTPVPAKEPVDYKRTQHTPYQLNFGSSAYEYGISKPEAQTPKKIETKAKPPLWAAPNVKEYIDTNEHSSTAEFAEKKIKATPNATSQIQVKGSDLREKMGNLTSRDREVLRCIVLNPMIQLSDLAIKTNLSPPKLEARLENELSDFVVRASRKRWNLILGANQALNEYKEI